MGETNDGVSRRRALTLTAATMVGLAVGVFVGIRPARGQPAQTGEDAKRAAEPKKKPGPKKNAGPPPKPRPKEAAETDKGKKK